MEDYQLDCNEHSAVQQTTQSDYSVALRRRLKNPQHYKQFPHGITYKNFGTRTKNDYDILVGCCEKMWKLNKRQAQKIVKYALTAHPAAKLKSYSRSEAIELFRKEFIGIGTDGAKVRWLGKKATEESNGYVPYFPGSDGHIFPNLAGGSFLCKTNNNRNKTVAVLYESNTWGTSAKGLSDFRQRALAKVNKINTSSVLTNDLIDVVVFLPQLKTDTSIICAKKKVNGEFTF